MIEELPYFGSLPKLAISQTGHVTLDSPDEDEPWLDKLKQVFKTDDVAMVYKYLNQLAALETDTSPIEKTNNLNANLAFIADMEPADHAEILLLFQMLGVHNKAMELLTSSDPKDTHAASRLLSLYQRQIDALTRYKKKGQQKITVERVTVADGGQAIVGNVGNQGG